MTIFQGNTKSLIFVVERWDKNQNVQQDIPFNRGRDQIELRLPVFALRADMSKRVETRYRK